MANCHLYLQDLTNAGVVYLCQFVQGLAVAGPQKPELLPVNFFFGVCFSWVRVHLMNDKDSIKIQSC